MQPRNHQNQVTPTVPPTREILPAFPCCFKTPRHKGSDVRTIARIPTAKPPMETPHIDRIYASLLITIDMDGAAPTWKVRDYATQTDSNRLKPKLPMTNLFWGPKRALSLMKSIVTQFWNIKLESASSYGHVLLQSKELRSPNATPHLGSSRLWDADWGTGAHPTASNCKYPTI